MLLHDIYTLFVDDFENGVTINIEDILKMLEKYLSKTQFIMNEELDVLDDILEKLEEVKSENNPKIVKRIDKILTQFNELLENNDDRSTEDYTESIDTMNITIENFVVKHAKRTDFNLIPEDKVTIVNDSVKLFEEIVEEEKSNVEILNNYFKNPKTALVNMSIKNKLNLYSLDRYGLVIRRNAYMKKNSLYGWKFDEDKKPIHYLVKPDICDDEENIKAVLNAQYLMNQKAFSPIGIIYKIYIKYYPERLLLFNIH